MGRARIDLNHAEVARMLRDHDWTLPVADRVAARARETAPVESGFYQSQITVEEEFTDRAVSRVVDHVDYALFVEARTGNLSRAIDAGGGP